jgi:transposase
VARPLPALSLAGAGPSSRTLRAVKELNVPGMTVSYAAQKYALSPSVLFRWRKLMSEGGKQAVKADDNVVAAAEMRELKKHIRELERRLAKRH